jgi:hypothetical protein
MPSDYVSCGVAEWAAAGKVCLQEPIEKNDENDEYNELVHL